MTIIETTPQTLPWHLRGNWAPILNEVTDNALVVEGSIPPELDGLYVRTGPNPKSGTSPHWFFGDGMVHGVRISGGRAEWYRNRYVQTPNVTEPLADAMGGLGDLARGTGNTHVIAHGGKLPALEEAHWPWALDRELNTIGYENFGGALTCSMTAHPKVCPITGELLAFSYFSFEPPYLHYVRISPDGQVRQVEGIDLPNLVMMHDFNVTQNHVVFMDLPVVFDLNLIANGLPFRFDRDAGARLGVMPRNGTNANVRWFDINPCYVFHPLNAYEDGDNIVLDVSRMSHVWRDGPMDFPSPMLWRWTIDTKTGSVAERQIDDHPADFPRVPDSRIGLKHRYGYLMGFDVGMSLDNAKNQAGTLLKYDQESGARSSINVGLGRQPGEAVFVPADGAKNEDDGYLITYVYDANTENSECVIYDAATMSDEPIAAIHLPRVPFGFHGSWVNATVAD